MAAYYSELLKIIKQYLGPETEFNVYVAEISTINIAIDIVKASDPAIPCTKCVIYTDS